MYYVLNGTTVVVTAMLGVIMIARLHAMYQQSRRLLIFLIVVFLAVNITNGVTLAEAMKSISEEEFILSGTHQCTAKLEGDSLLLLSMGLVLATIWEVFALCLVVWIAVKHFHQPQRAWLSIGDSVTELMKIHVFYFASIVAISCFRLVYVSPTISEDTYSLGTQMYLGVLLIFELVQKFVLGPHLILTVREHHTKLAADSDAGISVNSMVFQDRIHVSTSSSV